MGQLSRVVRFSSQFLVDRKYRNHVLDVIGRHVRAGESARAQVSAGPAQDFGWLAGRKMFLVGGCELTYIKDCLENAGILSPSHLRPWRGAGAARRGLQSLFAALAISAQLHRALSGPALPGSRSEGPDSRFDLYPRGTGG